MDNRRYRNIRRSRHCALLYLRNTLVGIVTAALAGCGVSMKPQAAQTITFTQNPPASAPFGGQFTVAASASSGLAVTFTSSGVCTNSGATYTMTSGAGVCSIIASQAGDANYAAAQATQTAAATLAAQTIAFTANAPTSAPYNGQFTVAASATSGLAVAFTSSGACTNSGATYTMTSGAGLLDHREPARQRQLCGPPQVTQAAAATLASQTIAFTENPPASAPYNSQFTVAAGATSGLAVTFTSSGACTNAGATYTVNSATGVCSVIANQPGNADYAAAPRSPRPWPRLPRRRPSPSPPTLQPALPITANSPSRPARPPACRDLHLFRRMHQLRSHLHRSRQRRHLHGHRQPGRQRRPPPPRRSPRLSSSRAHRQRLPRRATTPAPCSETLTLTYNVAAGTTIGSINVLTPALQTSTSRPRQTIPAPPSASPRLTLPRPPARLT